MRTCDSSDRALPEPSDDRLTFLARLTVVNAIQLAMALVANLILLMNMAKKMRFTIAQPITIVTWYISSLLLVVLTATASGPLRGTPQDNYIWSAAFYYGAYAACLYFFCSSLMVVTFWGAMKGKYSKDFQLTTSQRTLMLQTIMFLVYLLLGALVFSTIESWPYLDAVYWADVTLFTVGFGDFYPETTLGRALLFPYALIGVISLGLVVGSIRSLVLERGRRQLAARMLEKQRKRMLRRMVKRGKDDILIPTVDDDGDDEGDVEWSGQRLSSMGLTEFERRRREFELMRKIQANAEQRRRWMAMGVSTTVWLILWLVGAAIFQQCEVTYQGWTYFDGFYFAFVSLTTIGYGDVTPISPAGKSFFVFWSLLALPTMTVLISNAGDTVVKLIREWTDWLGVVTILPGERGFKREIKLFLRAISLGKIFDEDAKESPPGFLGDAEARYSSSDSESNDERNTAKDSGPRLEKSNEGLEREVRNVTGNQEMEQNEKGLVGDVNKNGSARGEPGEYDLLTRSPTTQSTTPSRPPTSSQLSGNGNGHLSFAEPPERSNSHRKTGSSSFPSSKRAGDGSSSTSSKKTRRGHSNNDISAQTVSMTRAPSMARTGAQLPAVPDDPHDYMVVLIDEISLVTQHMKSHPPRKYSFEEWAWYLRLIGEDEGSAETHTKPVPRSRRRNKKNETGGSVEGKTQGDDPGRLQWSWVGSRSPLMGSQEEAEWILEKLEQRLAEELRAMRDEALGREDSG